MRQEDGCHFAGLRADESADPRPLPDPRRIKAAYLTDNDIKYLAAYAARLRGTHLA